MFELRITTREGLGALWLPWCVLRDRPTELVSIDHEPHRLGEARQLRVRDVLDNAVRTALSSATTRHGQSSLTGIEHLARSFSDADRIGQVVLTDERPDQPQAFSVSDGFMLHEACHRACGLYAAGIEGFEVLIFVRPVFKPWHVYEQPTLRQVN